MSSFKLSGLFSDAVGKIGGSTFTRNRAGLYMRNWRSPINPRTAAQQYIRTIMKNVAQYWGTISQVYRDQWIDAASKLTWTNRFGDPFTPSGFDLFCMCNVNYLMTGAPYLVNAPSNFSCESPTSVGCTFVGENFLIAPEPEQQYNSTGFFVYATPGLSASITYVKRQYRYIGYIPEGTSWEYDAYTLYRSVFGLPSSGQVVHLNLRPVSIFNGYSQPILVSSCIYSNS